MIGIIELDVVVRNFIDIDRYNLYNALLDDDIMRSSAVNCLLIYTQNNLILFSILKFMCSISK